MPRRTIITAANRVTPAPRVEPKIIIDEDWVQPDRMNFGREAVYNPAVVRKRIANVIAMSPIFKNPIDQWGSEEEMSARRVKDLEDYADGKGFSGSYGLHIERSWGVGANLDIATRYVWDGSSNKELDGETYRVGFLNYEVSINWSSTGRSVATAQASVVLYQELINLGGLITSVVESFDGKIASVVKMIPNPAYVAPDTEAAV